MIKKGSLITIPCYCCLNVRGQKKIINIELEHDHEEGKLYVILTTQCLACNKLSRQHFNHTGGGPLVNGTGFKIEGYD